MARNCPRCHPLSSASDPRSPRIRIGVYRRRSDKKWIQRFLCKICRKSFSSATFDPCYQQKKRQLNQSLFDLLASGNSQRRCAYLLKINRKTVKRKFLFLGKQSLVDLWRHNFTRPRAQVIEFDDLETFEHSKCKPLSVTLAVESGSRRILNFVVSSMPPKGTIARRAFKKYGPRLDERPRGRKLLLSSLKGLVMPNVVIKSDQNPHYTNDVKLFFKNSAHVQLKGRDGAITGQGELKKTGFDPLFSLNHTCAKLRADVNRLIRKTWCTTKKAERLRYHLAITSLYHNRALLAPKRV
jgi:transposase-like protein